MMLSDIKKHMIDLRRSEYDKSRSDPAKGQYHWAKKVYLKFDDYKDDQTRPNFVYRWVAFDEDDDFLNFNKWRMKWEAVPVDYKDEAVEVYPEPLVPTVEGNYRFMDMMLMRIPLEVDLDRIEGDRKLYDKAREGLDKKFRSECVQEGAVFDGEIKV